MCGGGEFIPLEAEAKIMGRELIVEGHGKFQKLGKFEKFCLKTGIKSTYHDPGIKISGEILENFWFTSPPSKFSTAHVWW